MGKEGRKRERGEESGENSGKEGVTNRRRVGSKKESGREKRKDKGITYTIHTHQIKLYIKQQTYRKL